MILKTQPNQTPLHYKFSKCLLMQLSNSQNSLINKKTHNLSNSPSLLHMRSGSKCFMTFFGHLKAQENLQKSSLNKALH
jgi:hypothetical protein